MVKAGYAGASVESSTKEILIFLAVVLAVVIVVAYLIKKGIMAVPDAIKNIIKDAGDTIKKEEDKSVSAIATAAAGAGATPDQVAALVEKYNNMVSADNIGAFPAAAVYVGNLITPTSVLAAATKQGQQFTADMASHNDTARYDALNPISKGLVTLGEGLTRTLTKTIIGTGLSPYDAGRAVTSWWDNLVGGLP